MATKTSIIGELGEPSLLLPQRLQQALAANDRVKFCFTLLQAAESHANHPQEPPLDLTAERSAVQLPAGELDAAVAESRRDPDGTICVSGAGRLRQWMFEDIASMSAPLSLAGVPEAPLFAERERRLAAALPAFDNDRVPAGLIGSHHVRQSRSGRQSAHSRHGSAQGHQPAAGRSRGGIHRRCARLARRQR